METSKDILSVSVNYHAMNYGKASISDAFIAGAKWYKENLWHSVSHLPDKNTLCLVQATTVTEDLVYSSCFLAIYNGIEWVSMNPSIKKLSHVLKYIYASDLLI